LLIELVIRGIRFLRHFRILFIIKVSLYGFKKGRLINKNKINILINISKIIKGIKAFYYSFKQY
jgi:hypothetical protein